MTLTETQCWFVANALKIAAEQYKQDAITLTAHGMHGTFTDYANQAESFAAAFEGAREVIIR